MRHIAIAFIAMFFLSLNMVQPSTVKADYKYKPALGFWFGPTQPLFSTNEAIDGFLGGGIFHRAYLPLNRFFYNVDLSYMHFNSDIEKRMDIFPATLSFGYELPVNLPVKIVAKAGGGMSYIKIKPENKSGWDPNLLLGGEFFFPAGKVVRIGLRVDFLWHIERHITSGERQVYQNGSYITQSGAVRDGYTLNMGLMVYFNFVK